MCILHIFENQRLPIVIEVPNYNGNFEDIKNIPQIFFLYSLCSKTYMFQQILAKTIKIWLHRVWVGLKNGQNGISVHFGPVLVENCM